MPESIGTGNAATSAYTSAWDKELFIKLMPEAKRVKLEQSKEVTAKHLSKGLAIEATGKTPTEILAYIPKFAAAHKVKCVIAKDSIYAPEWDVFNSSLTNNAVKSFELHEVIAHIRSLGDKAILEVIRHVSYGYPQLKISTVSNTKESKAKTAEVVLPAFK